MQTQLRGKKCVLQRAHCIQQACQEWGACNEYGVGQMHLVPIAQKYKFKMRILQLFAETYCSRPTEDSRLCDYVEAGGDTSAPKTN